MSFINFFTQNKKQKCEFNDLKNFKFDKDPIINKQILDEFIIKYKFKNMKLKDINKSGEKNLNECYFKLNDKYECNLQNLKNNKNYNKNRANILKESKSILNLKQNILDYKNQ